MNKYFVNGKEYPKLLITYETEYETHYVDGEEKKYLKKRPYLYHNRCLYRIYDISSKDGDIYIKSVIPYGLEDE